ncbi:unnamed protein product [Scytosiphon promiscuus]
MKPSQFSFDVCNCGGRFAFFIRCATLSLLMTALIASAVVSIPFGLNGRDSMQQRLYQLAKDDVLDILGSPEECEGQQPAKQPCTNAGQCGKGWLYRRHNLVLVIPPWAREADESVHLEFEDNDEPSWNAGESRTVTVVGLRGDEGGDVGEESDCHSQDITMLLRLEGPEALAEAAVPVEGRCAWTVDFRPLIAGVYTFDATVLYWKGGLEANRTMCNEVPGQYGEGSVKMDPVHVPDGPFDFSARAEGCCALCSRSEGCVAWSASDKHWQFMDGGGRCFLYSSVEGSPVEHDVGRGYVFSGTPRNEETKMYLGPSLSVGERWCLPKNTQLLGSGKQYIVSAPVAAATDAGSADDELPLCRRESSVPPDGRWVSLQDVACDFDAGVAPSTVPHFEKDLFGVTMPAECWMRHDPRVSAALETGYEWRPYGCRYDLMNTESRQKCFRDNDVTRFLDYGDSMIYLSGDSRTPLWLPNSNSTNEWKKSSEKLGESYGCRGSGKGYYLEEHSSATGITSHYCLISDHATEPAGTLRGDIASFHPDVVLANFALVHRIWHLSVREWEEFLEDLGKALDEMVAADEHLPRYFFWLSSPFLVSEREPQTTQVRAEMFDEALRNLLEPRGWIEIDWMAMTRKWALEVFDGMHHNWKSQRMLAHIITHHICHDSS